MARYLSNTESPEDLRWFIGLILSKTGPVDISEEDILLYNAARLVPFMAEVKDRAGFRTYLLGEDEWPKEGEEPAVR